MLPIVSVGKRVTQELDLAVLQGRFEDLTDRKPRAH